MKGQTGIWIDGKQAIIVHFFNDTQVVDTLDSEVDYGHHGAAHELPRQGGHTMFHERAEEERIHHERRHFLEHVKDKLDPVFEIAIWGPAQTKHELIRVLGEDSDFETESIKLTPADGMTTNQFIDLVQEHFHPAKALK
jgi:hypothetical protein